MTQGMLADLAGRVDLIVGATENIRRRMERLEPIFAEQAEVNRRLLAIAEHEETMRARLESIEAVAGLQGAAITRHRRGGGTILVVIAAVCCLAIAIGVNHMHEDAQITHQVQQSKRAFCDLLSAQLTAPPSTPYGRALAAAATRLRTDFGC